MFRNYVFVCAVIVLSIVVRESLVLAVEGSLNVTEQKVLVSGTRKDPSELKAMRERGIASALKGASMADQYKEVDNEIRLTEKELSDLLRRKKVLEQVTKKLKVARFRAQCREKANPSADSEVLTRKLQDFAFQINNQKEDLAEIDERIPVLEERLYDLKVDEGILGTLRGKGNDGLDKNLDREFEAEIRKRWDIGSANINLSSLIDYP